MELFDNLDILFKKVDPKKAPKIIVFLGLIFAFCKLINVAEIFIKSE